MNTFLMQNWGGLTWSDWVPLDAPTKDFRLLPQEPGFYRVRVVDQPVLSYIGQTGRNLRQRIGELRRPLYHSDEQMPWNDPHTAAQSLWALRIAEGMRFECSVAVADLETQDRHGFEDMLLWKYRVEKRESTLCNYGRFHPQYFRSTNRREKRQGGLLPMGQTNPASGPSFPPLNLHGSPNELDWMNLKWSPIGNLTKADFTQITHQGGVYKIWDDHTKQLLYVGESGDLQSRLLNHSRKNWGASPVTAAYYASEEEIFAYQRHEIESDLLGAFYFSEKRTPLFQYLNHQQILEAL